MTALESHLPVSRDVSIVKLRHPLRWLSGAVLLVILAILVDALVTNERFGWDIVGHYLFSHQILVGLRRTLWLTLIAMLIGLVLGTVLAIMRMSTNPVAQVAAGLYIWFFRGTPLLVQLIFWYNLSALYPKLSFGIPFGPTFADVQTNSVLTVFLAAILGLGLNESAYMSEIIRAGLLSVDPGQKAAAEALGMRDSLIFRRIVWPQAMRGSSCRRSATKSSACSSTRRWSASSPSPSCSTQRS